MDVKIKLLTFALLTFLMLSTMMIFPAYASDSTTFSLALSTNQIQYTIPAGTMFNGSIATTGMVRFWVTAPNEIEIVNLGIIDKTNSFSFVAQQNGTYTFNFENDLPNTIQVTFSYTANPQLPNSNTGIPLTYFLVVGTVAVAGSLLIFFGIRHKTRKAKSANQNTELSTEQTNNSDT
jgi:hypothetical protein